MRHGSLVKLTFFEFTTGALHPLTFKSTEGLPLNLLDVAHASVEILGGHVLTKAMFGLAVCCFYPVSRNLGTATLVSRNLI